MISLELSYHDLIIPGDWTPMFRKIQNQNGVIMVLGKSDSGKTSLIKLLAAYLVRRNRKIALIDLDIGQSILGLPGTMGIGIVNRSNLKNGLVQVNHRSFFGATSPAKGIDRFLEKAYRLYTVAHKENADVFLIDTTGLVMGSLGAYLKGNLIKRINPTALIALQFEQELEPILTECEILPALKIYRVKPYQRIIRKNWTERKTRRKKQFELYFQDAQLRDLDFSAIPIRDFNFDFDFGSKSSRAAQIFRQFQREIISTKIVEKRTLMVLSPEPQYNPDKELLSKIKDYFKVEHIVIIFPEWFQNLLISLTDTEGLSNGLGIIGNIDFKKKIMTTYLPISVSSKALAQIELGMFRIRLDGTELPYLEPEQY
ncbi:MAG: hypothetical protein GX240_00145 [Candidatus Atribacteria bacterium]|jgi:polynucleotide 5'-kinase involved in rRNA processing|nr:hypothetical protein [Candidatus Atribacteria bacterium]